MNVNLLIYSAFQYHTKEKITCLVFFGHHFFQYPLHILLRLPRMNRQGFAQLHCKFELPTEHNLLNITRGKVVMVIESNLTPANITGVFHCFQS